MTRPARDQPVVDAGVPRTGQAPTRPQRRASVEAVPLAPLRAGGTDEPRGRRLVNVPNALTFLRALLVPVILGLLVVGGTEPRWWAFGFFAFAAATDTVDGWVARRWHGVTAWGQLADPVADKLLIIGSLASLAAVGDLPWWAVTVIVAREAAVTLLRVWLVRRLDLVMPASRWGKAKTVGQVVAVAAFLLPGVGDGVRLVLLWVAIALTLWSGVEYGFRASRLVRAARGGGRAGPDASTAASARQPGAPDR